MSVLVPFVMSVCLYLPCSPLPFLPSLPSFPLYMSIPPPLKINHHIPSHLPTLRNHHIERRFLASHARILDLAHDLHAVGDAAEDDVFVVEERGGDGADEELGAVCVGAGILLFSFRKGSSIWDGGLGVCV